VFQFVLHCLFAALCMQATISDVARAESASPRLEFAQAQPGSVGGTIGKGNKSISGGEDAKPAETPKKRPASAAKPAAAAPKGPQTFQNPMTNGLRTDLCQTATATGCGEPSANMWCQRNGFKRAAAFQWGFGAPAWRQGENSRCDGPCGVLTEVTCE
jgi:hypothetical protein